MKLKRFLLRYEPPGVGLEVEDDAGLIVRHKDLPPTAEVGSIKEIKRQVDLLIAGETELLTKRKHRPALVQLLGRLYQIEVNPDDEADEGAETSRKSIKAPEGSAAVAEPKGFQEGAQVVLVQLKGKLQDHNGNLGTLIKSKQEKNKFEVLLSGVEQAEPLKVKGVEHIVPVAPKGTPLVVGTHVVIRSLRNHVELNGCLGRVVECHEENHRFEVRATESGQLFRVKQDNLVAVSPSDVHLAAGAGGLSKENREPNAPLTPGKKAAINASASSGPVGGIDTSVAAAGDATDDVFEPGSVVQLTGLKTAMVYNGQTAEVLSVDRVRSRYEISLTDGSVKTIRAENVRLVSGPAKQRRHKDGSKGRDA